MNADANNASAPSAPAAVAEPVEVEELSDSQRETWIKSGELPAKETAAADGTAPSKPGKATDHESGAAKEAESGTAKKSEKTDKQERNWRALESRAEKAEREARELREKYEKQEPKTEAAASSSAEPQPPERPKRPALLDFKTVPEFDVAMDKYDASMTEYQEKSQAFTAAKAQADKNLNDAISKWKGMVGKAKEKHDDFDTIALNPEVSKLIPVGSSIDEVALQSEMGAEILYHLAKNPDEIKRILSFPRIKQFRELAKIEDELSGSEEKPVRKKAITDSLPPPREVGGKGAAVTDEDAETLKRATAGDDGATSDYIERQNKKDLENRRRARR